MKLQKQCSHCQRLFFPNPRSKNQKYCSKKECRRARKTNWERNKLRTDPDYRRNRKESQAAWRIKNPDYYKNYRAKNPSKNERNRKLQKQRDAKRRALRLAKMDASANKFQDNSGVYYLVPVSVDLAKKDALIQKVKIIPQTYPDFSASCKEGPVGFFGDFPIQGTKGG